MSPPHRLGRRSECATLDQLVASVRAGSSRALVLRGEAGVGKTSLLQYLTSSASGCGIARAAGVESEMELPLAGTQQGSALRSPIGSNASTVSSATRSVSATATLPTGTSSAWPF